MSYEAVVYDLDGTLVELDVDWSGVHEAVLNRLGEHDIDAAEYTLWELLESADEYGIAAVVEETLSEHERAGAETARRLSTADELPRDSPVGVCSLNCETACRIALDRHELIDHVDAIVGRDTVRTHKPDPEPLLRAIELIGTTPENTVFVGDSRRDEKTAERAGVAFEYVSERTT